MAESYPRITIQRAGFYLYFSISFFELLSLREVLIEQ